MDFYVLSSAAATQRLTFACRLTEKAYLRDLKVVVLSESAADVEVMDELLWTFNERSFVPHAIRRPGRPDDEVPVQLTPDLDTVEAADLLVNLTTQLPARLERFARIAEIIDADDGRRRLGREKFKAYRELKLALETHQLTDADAAT